MKIPLLIATAFVGVLIVGCSDNSSDTSGSNDISDDIEETIEQTLENYLDKNIASNEAGLAILVIKDGDTVYKKGIGMANKNLGLQITADTGFRLASVSKPFTAMAIMQLYEQGSLDLDDSITQYMPEFDESWEGIKIKHLLSHRSGIFDYLNDVGSEIGYENMTNQKIIDYFVSHPELEYAPGTQAKYINTGFLFLSELVSRVSGMDFSDYMSEFVFQVLSMESSYINDENTELRYGDALNFGDRDTWFGTKIYTRGASAQVSSINDLAKFINALKSFELVSEPTFNTMIEPYSVFDGYDYGYGIGLNFSQDQLVSYGHGGTHDGYRSRLTIDLEKGYELVVLGNNGDVSTGHINNIRNLVSRFYELDSAENPTHLKQ